MWHHVSAKPTDQGGRGPKELTGMVDLTRSADHKGRHRVRARLLDLTTGRSGPAYAQWLMARNKEFRDQIKVATLDTFHGYKSALADELEDAVAVADAFHIVKLGTEAVDEVRRRVQRSVHGHRGRKGDPLYAIKVLDSLPSCPIPEIKRLGKTLKQWRAAFLAYFDTGRANNGGAEPINGLIELHRRIARGFRNYDSYRLRMLLIGGGLANPHLE